MKSLESRTPSDIHKRDQPYKQRANSHLATLLHLYSLIRVLDTSLPLYIVYTAFRMRVCIIVFALAGLASAEVRFNRDIRPIMAQTCFRCHGPDKNARMAGMRLDIRDEALRPTASGAVPIVPGDPDRSAIVQRIFAPAPRTMPPAHVHKDLTAAQKQTIRQRVAEGAK